MVNRMTSHPFATYLAEPSLEDGEQQNSISFLSDGRVMSLDFAAVRHSFPSATMAKKSRSPANWMSLVHLAAGSAFFGSRMRLPRGILGASSCALAVGSTTFSVSTPSTSSSGSPSTLASFSG